MQGPSKRVKREESEESEESEISDSECSEIVSDEDPDNIELSYKEFYEEQLPMLLNSTRSRTMTVKNYIAPIQLRNQTVRASDNVENVDFRAGVFIDKAGKIQLKHEQTGIYFCTEEKPVEEETENKIKDDFENSEHSESESETEFDFDAEVEGFVEEDKLEETLKLSKQEKTDLINRELANSSVDDHHTHYMNSKERTAITRQLLDETQKIIQDWDAMKSKYRTTLRMHYESALHIENPTFEMDFDCRVSNKKLKVVYDCESRILKCECSNVFKTTKTLVQHISDVHQ